MKNRVAAAPKVLFPRDTGYSHHVAECVWGECDYYGGTNDPSSHFAMNKVQMETCKDANTQIRKYVAAAQVPVHVLALFVQFVERLEEWSIY